MDLVTLLYLAPTLGELKSGLTENILLPISFFAVVASLGTKAIMWVDKKEEELPLVDKMLKYSTICVIISLTLSGLSIFIPSEKTMYLMTGASIGQNILESKETNIILNKTYKIIDNKLNELLSNDKDEVKNNT